MTPRNRVFILGAGSALLLSVLGALAFSVRDGEKPSASAPPPVAPVALSPEPSRRAPSPASAPAVAAEPPPSEASAPSAGPREKVLAAMNADSLLEGRKAVLSALEQTRPTSATWAAQGHELFSKWLATQPAGSVVVEPPQCFEGGCLLRMTGGDFAELDARIRNFPSSKEADSWPGGKLSIPPSPEGERQLAAVILLRPDGI